MSLAPNSTPSWVCVVLGFFLECTSGWHGERTVGSGFTRKRWSVNRMRRDDLPTPASPADQRLVSEPDHTKWHLGTCVRTSDDKFENIIPAGTGHSLVCCRFPLERSHLYTGSGPTPWEFCANPVRIPTDTSQLNNTYHVCNLASVLLVRIILLGFLHERKKKKEKRANVKQKIASINIPKLLLVRCGSRSRRMSVLQLRGAVRLCCAISTGKTARVASR